MRNYKSTVKKTSPRKKKTSVELPPDKLKEFRKAEKEKEDAQKALFCQWLWDEHGLKGVPEFKFHPTRRWRIDYYFEGRVKIGLEVEGSVFTLGRHTRPQGFMADIEKYNQFSLYNIFLVRTTPSDVKIYDFYIEPNLLNLLKQILL